MMNESLLGMLGNGDCVALVSPNTLQYYTINGASIQSNPLPLSKNLEAIKSLVCDPFGQYIILYGVSSVFIVYLNVGLVKNSVSLVQSVYEVEQIELPQSDKNIVCVKCHPRIPNSFFVLLDDGSLIHYRPFIQKNPMGSVSLVLSSLPNVRPTAFSFGCNRGSDQFSLYISYNNGYIGIINPLPISGYSMTKEELGALWNESSQTTRNWLLLWSQAETPNYQPPISSCNIDIHIVYKPSSAIPSQSDLFIEELENDIILIEQVSCDAIHLFIRSVYEDTPTLTRIASLSTVQLNLQSVLHDIQPHSFILMASNQIYALSFPWLSTFVSTKTIGEYTLHTIHMQDAPFSKNTIVMNSLYQGHCILNLEEVMDLKVLKLINCQAHSSLQLNNSIESTPLHFSKELSKEIASLERVQSSQTFHHFIQQLNSLTFSDVTLDNAISVDILNQYQLPYILQLARIKEAIIQTTTQLHEAIQQAEARRAKMEGLVEKEKQENEKLLQQMQEVLLRQQSLDLQFNRVVRKMQEMIQQNTDQDQELREGIQMMIQALHKVQMQIQQAVHTIQSVENFKKVRVERAPEKEEVDNGIIKSLETIQQNLINATKLKKESAELLENYELSKNERTIIDSI